MVYLLSLSMLYNFPGEDDVIPAGNADAGTEYGDNINDLFARMQFYPYF